MNNYDPNQRIIPRGAYGVVHPVGFAIRFLLEYDMDFLQDRLRCEIFVDGLPSGTYAVMRLDDDFVRVAYGSGASGQQAVEEAVRRYGKDLERLAIDSFMGLGFREDVRILQRQVSELTERLNRPGRLKRAWLKVYGSWLGMWGKAGDGHDDPTDGYR